MVLSSRVVRLWSWGLLAACLVLLMGVTDALAVQLGDATITLQSVTYKKNQDLTRFVYRVVLPDDPSGETWVLGLGTCVLPQMIDAATSLYTWTEAPFRGLEFALTQKKQSFRVWLQGQWDAGPVDIALLHDDSMIGVIDGPFCDSASLAMELVAGEAISFPGIIGPGTILADQETYLRVTSSALGWMLGHSLELSVPAGASEEVTRQLLVLTFQPYAPAVGETDIYISYALQINEDDFRSLPQGTYVIGILFTLSTD